MKAEEYIEAQSFMVFNKEYTVIFKKDALEAIKMVRNENPEHIYTVQDCELAVRVTKEKAVEAFRCFVQDYFHEAGHNGISNNSEHYIGEFKKKLEENQ